MRMFKRVVVLVLLLLGLALPCLAWRGFDRGVGDYVEVYSSPDQIKVSDIVEVYDCAYARNAFMVNRITFIMNGKNRILLIATLLLVSFSSHCFAQTIRGTVKNAGWNCFGNL